MEPHITATWDHRLVDPSLRREAKPRDRGITMVIDKGLGLTAFRDLLQLGAEYIDFIKLGFGTAGLTPAPVLKEKLNLAKQYGIHLYPGGTFFEIAYAQEQASRYFETLSRLGFSWVEISDGTVHLSENERSRWIHHAQSLSFSVITEIGKKQKGSVTPIPHLVRTFHRDREDGASYIIVEGRESGKNIGIYDSNGKTDTAYVSQVYSQVEPDRLIWESPQTPQQVSMIRLLGPGANLGNIPPQEVLPLESLRRGLRADTFFTWKKEPIGGSSL